MACSSRKPTTPIQHRAQQDGRAVVSFASKSVEVKTTAVAPHVSDAELHEDDAIDEFVPEPAKPNRKRSRTLALVSPDTDTPKRARTVCTHKFVCLQQQRTPQVLHRLEDLVTHLWQQADPAQTQVTLHLSQTTPRPRHLQFRLVLVTDQEEEEEADGSLSHPSQKKKKHREPPSYVA